MIALSASALGGLAPEAKADQMIEIMGAGASHGIQVSVGQCPCFRWTVQVQAAGGRIDTKEILISADALLQLKLTHTGNYGELTSRMFTVGAFDALIKGGHVGLGFKGYTKGYDENRGLSDIVRTGVYALANIVQNDAVRFDIRTGIDYEKLVNMSDDEMSRTLGDVAAVVSFNKGPWSGKASAHVGTQFKANSTRVGAAASVRTRVVSFQDFELGLTAEVSGEHDPFLELLGLKSNNLVGSLLMDLSFVKRSMQN